MSDLAYLAQMKRNAAAILEQQAKALREEADKLEEKSARPTGR